MKHSSNRILIAEDDLTSRVILSAVLKKSGYEVMETCDGSQAWEEMQKPNSPRLAILDWMMPKMDGLEVVKRIRSMKPNSDDGVSKNTDRPYLIMLTAKNEKSDIVSALDAGADDYLSKPFDRGELRARIGVGKKMLDLQSSLNHAHETMRNLAMHDPLTGMLNRRAVMNVLEREVARVRRTRASFSVGMCDIDHFKKVNDAHGHQVGDDVICEVVHRLQDGLRDSDVVGRYGGEEFLIVAVDSKGTPEEMLYQRLCGSIVGEPIKTRDCSIPVSVSIGVAAGGGDKTAEEILAQADNALYQAKEQGRNRVIFSS